MTKEKQVSICPDYNVIEVIDAIKEAIDVLHGRGTKIRYALNDLAKILNIAPSRIKKLYWVDKRPVISAEEWVSLRRSAGLFFVNEAKRLRKLAEKYETVGDNLMSSQQDLPPEADKKWQIAAEPERQLHAHLE